MGAPMLAPDFSSPDTAVGIPADEKKEDSTRGDRREIREDCHDLQVHSEMEMREEEDIPSG